MRKLTSIFFLALLTISVLSFYTPQIQGVFGSEDIFFEYGAESGELQPPFEDVGMRGSGERTGSYAQIVNSPVRTANKSIEIYQKAPPKSDAQRRVGLWQYDDDTYPTVSKELYMSWWVFFPDESPWSTTDPDGWGTNIGGWSLWFGDSSNRWRWRVSARFHVHATTREVETGWGFYKFPVNDKFPSDDDDTNYYIDDHLDEWIHFQTYVKLDGANSIITHWINNTQVYTKTNWNDWIDGVHIISLDPEDYSEWNSKGCAYSGGNPNGVGLFESQLYDDVDSAEKRIYVDDIVFATEKVSEAYGVDYPSVEFEKFEDGFNDGTLDAWDGTQLVGGWITPVETPTHEGSYSAKFNVTGDSNKVARLKKYIQPVENITIRSYVRFPQLPIANSDLDLLRMGNATGDWMSLGSIRNGSSGDYSWKIDTRNGENKTVDNSIQINQWYSLELSMVANSSGYVRMYVNDTLMCEKTGDFTGYGEIGFAYPQLYDSSGQGSETIVYHDSIIIDQGHIGIGTFEIFQIAEFSIAYIDEGGGFSPLPNVKINGSFVTDDTGYYEWSALTYNTEYLFVVENPSGYYPAWCLNVEGSYSWNGTHYFLYHNVTEEQSGYIQILFSSTTNVFINYTNAKITSASLTSTSFHIQADDTGTKTINISVADRGEPNTVTGLAGWTFDSSNNIYSMSVTFSSSQSISLRWGSVVGTSLINSATYWTYQRKTFYAQGRFWVFYSDGQHIVFRSSTDGTTWGNSTVAVTGLLNGENFSLVYESPFVHYVASLNTDLVYRRGEPLSNGSITWNSSETVDSATVFSRPYICLDSNGYPWMGYVNKSGGQYYPYVSKSSTKNGSWTMETNFPYQLHNVGVLDWVSIPVPCGSNIYVIYTITQTMYARLYVGSWNAEEMLVQSMTGSPISISVTSYASTVNIAYILNFDIYHLQFDGTRWTTPFKVTDNIFIVESQLTQFEDTLYLFWEIGGTIYLKRYVNQTWDALNTGWLSESSVTYTKTSFYDAQSNRIGLTWTDSSKIVKFTWFYTTASGNFLLEGYDGVTVSSIVYNAPEGKLTFTSTGSGSAIVRGADTTLTVTINGSKWSSWSSDQPYITISVLSGTSNISLYSLIEDFLSSDRSDRGRRDDLDVIKIIEPIIAPFSTFGLYVVVGGVGIFIIGAFYTKITKTRTRGISKPNVPRISKPRGIQSRPTPRKKAPRKPKKAKRPRRFVK